MRRTLAALGSALFLVIAPGTAAVLVPWWLTDGWSGGQPSLAMRLVGATLLTLGGVMLLSSFARFAFVGRGTPAPVAPPVHLVVSGYYRYVRNPMYVAIISVVLGEAFLLSSIRLVWYAAAIWVATALFVKVYEEPKLRRSFGEAYLQYCGNVRAWIPRLRPWQPS